MERRIIDLSISNRSFPGYDPEMPLPLPAHVEVVGGRLSRAELMGWLNLQKIALEDEQLTEISLTVDPCPGTHLETYYPEKFWYPDVLERRVSVRDVSYIPINQLAGDGVILDIPKPEEIEIRMDEIRAKANLIKEGDILFIRTGRSDRWAGEGPSEKIYTEGSTGIVESTAKWLIAKKEICAFGLDSRGVDAFRGASGLPVHRLFHLNHVVILEDLCGLSQLPDQRALIICGTPLKCEHLTGAPARVIAVQKSEENYQVFDLTHTMKAFPKIEPRLSRNELLSEKSNIVRRLAILPYSIVNQWGMDDLSGPEYVRFTSRLGTNIIAPMEKDKRGDIASVDVNRLAGRAAVLNLSHIGPRDEITGKDLEEVGSHVCNSDIVLLRTGFADQYRHDRQYFDLTPGLTKDAALWLLKREVKAVVVDMASIERQEPSQGQGPTGQIYHMFLSNGIPVVESAINLWLIRKNRCFIACLPLKIQGLEGSPVHVIAVEEW